MKKLKNCPFCGGKADVMDDLYGLYVKCGNCDCAVGLYSDMDRNAYGMFESPEEAIKAWNRRGDVL